MAAGLANTVVAPSVAVVPRIEPYLIEVVLPFPLGSADQAIAAAAEKVAELLAQPDLGAATVDAPADLKDESQRVADTAFVQGVARLIVEQAEAFTLAAITDLMKTPRKLRRMLPTEPPPDAGTPWLDNGVLSITPDA